MYGILQFFFFFFVWVLLFASVKRFSGSRMQDFLFSCYLETDPLADITSHCTDLKCLIVYRYPDFQSIKYYVCFIRKSSWENPEIQVVFQRRELLITFFCCWFVKNVSFSSKTIKSDL